MSVPPDQPELTPEQMRMLQAEMDQVRVADVLVQTAASLLNLAARKAGLVPLPDEPEGAGVDWGQVRAAIEAVRALLPLMEDDHGEALKPLRDALAQLQLAYARAAGSEQGGGDPDEPGGSPPEGGAAGPAEPGGPGAAPGPGGGPGPAQSSGRLWIPGG